jgi:hypothetical protein
LWNLLRLDRFTVFADRDASDLAVNARAVVEMVGALELVIAA